MGGGAAGSLGSLLGTLPKEGCPSLRLGGGQGGELTMKSNFSSGVPPFSSEGVLALFPPPLPVLARCLGWPVAFIPSIKKALGRAPSPGWV